MNDGWNATMQQVWTVYHECGHAIAAMSMGIEGRIETQGVKGAVHIERRHSPVGSDDIVYGYAGAIAEALARLGWLDQAQLGERPYVVVWEEMMAFPPSCEDLLSIGDFDSTWGEFCVATDLLLKHGEALEELVNIFIGNDDPPEVLWFPIGCPEVISLIRRTEGDSKMRQLPAPRS